MSWYLFRGQGYGVYVAVWCRGRVLVIRNSYKSRDTLPSGGLHRGESQRDAAARELREEVGIRVDPAELREVKTFLSVEEYKKDYSTVFEISFDSVPGVQIDHREVVRAEFLSPEECATREFVSIVRQYFEWRAEGRPEAGDAPPR